MFTVMLSGPKRRVEYNLIGGNHNLFNLYNAITSYLGHPADYPIELYFRLQSGAHIYSSNGVSALTIGSGWHSTTDIEITVDPGCGIIGKGGNGGNAGYGTSCTTVAAPQHGSNGGNAIILNHDIVLINNGTIGGGGGGGAGGIARAFFDSPRGGGEGGGGAGFDAGVKGTYGHVPGGCNPSIPALNNGGNGSITNGGNGGQVGFGTSTAGVGGSIGVNGGNAVDDESNISGCAGSGGGGLGANGGSAEGYVGGAGGKAVVLNGYSVSASGNTLYGGIG